ncbi:MAG TPA: PAS domain-containing sensor histidine kinase [Burkholderiales bacterium]|nr:PAS domain-containing sensor histidine kinase [Burkholderiales bacterium]
MPTRPPAPPAEELVRLLLAQCEEYALFFTNPEGVITDWYPGAEHVFGFTAEEMVGQSARRLFNPADLERGADQHEFTLARAAKRSEDDRWHLRKDGARFWGSGALFALYGPAGEITGYAKIVRNRTDLKTQTESLDNRVQALDTTLERTRVFLATLAHEMRNPLAPLSNAAQLLRADVASETGKEALRIIERQIALLSRLVEDLMDTARISAGKVQLELTVVDLREVFDAAAEIAAPLAEARGLEFKALPIAGAVPVCVDAQRMHQVFHNLLDNAIKYTPRGGRIVFNMTTEGGDAIVRVEDTGIGMSPEIQPRIFDVFTQEDSARQHARGGVGLGLALVHDLVALHGGTVQARSEGHGKGSVFTVRLPIYHAEQP